MSDRWENGAAELLLPKRLVLTFGFCLVLLAVVAVYVKTRDRSDASRINKGIEEAQGYIEQEDYAAAFDVLSETYADNIGKTFDSSTMDPLKEKGCELLKTATSGIFAGYGLPYEGRYDIKDPVYLYLYIPQPGEEMYKEGCYYFGWSKEELKSRDEIFALFSRPEFVMEYREIGYEHGFDYREEPTVNIENAGENESDLNPYGAVHFTYDYIADCLAWGSDIVLSRVE